MTVNIEKRDFDFLKKLENQIKYLVLQISQKLEELTSWNAEKPMILPNIPIKKIIKARIGCIVGQSNYLLEISEDFIRWLDKTALMMNSNILFRKSLYMNLISGKNDLSFWMLTNWTNWVVNHEIGHLTGGHLSRTNDFEWNEFEAVENGKRVDNKLRIALEYDADIYAAIAFFGSIHLVLKDKVLEKIKHNIFFDIGIIFSAIFMEMDILSTNSNTHPKANQRFMTFVHVGLAEYARKTGKDPILEFEALTNGALKCFSLFPDMYGFQFAEKLIDFKMKELLDSRNLLIENGFLDKRLTPRDHDWLDEKQPFLYVPTRKLKAWDLFKRPELL